MSFKTISFKISSFPENATKELIYNSFIVLYLYNNIYPFIRIPGTQDVSKNFICYSIDDMSDLDRNDRMKEQYITQMTNLIIDIT